MRRISAESEKTIPKTASKWAMWIACNDLYLGELGQRTIVTTIIGQMGRTKSSHLYMPPPFIPHLPLLMLNTFSHCSCNLSS